VIGTSTRALNTARTTAPEVRGRPLPFGNFIVQLAKIEQECKRKLTCHHACNRVSSFDREDFCAICDKVFERGSELLLRVELTLKFLELWAQPLHFDALLKQSSDRAEQDQVGKGIESSTAATWVPRF
jgi:hypothetical protein